MLQLQDLLRIAGLDPADANVILNSPSGPELPLRYVLPSLAKDRPAALIEYHSSHSPRAEAVLRKGRSHFACFSRIDDDIDAEGRRRMIFLGLFENLGVREMPVEEARNTPEMRWLQDTVGFEYAKGREGTLLRFDMRLSSVMQELRGRLICRVRLTPAYARLAERIEAPVAAILETGLFESEPPDWRSWVVPAGIVRAMPSAWAARLREWRGIYMILDGSDGARYVGSAYGGENLLGRWRAHVAGDAGVTVQLKKRDPAQFQFSILERLSPDSDIEEVVSRERSWMKRLGTLDYGLNS